MECIFTSSSFILIMQSRTPQCGGFLPRSEISWYRSGGKDGETCQNRKKTQGGSKAMGGWGERSFMLCLWTLTPLTTQGLFSGPASTAPALNPPIPPNRLWKAHIHRHVMRPSPASLGELYDFICWVFSHAVIIFYAHQQWEQLLVDIICYYWKESLHCLLSLGEWAESSVTCESFHCFSGIPEDKLV